MGLAARLVEVGDMFADAVGRYLKAAPIRNKVVRKWASYIDDQTVSGWNDDEKLFNVHILPDMYESEVLTRRSDQNTYRYVVRFIEPYLDQGEPSTAWFDKRIALAADVIDVFGENRETLNDDIDGPRCTSAKFTDLYDELLLTCNKVFWSEAEFEYREIDE